MNSEHSQIYITALNALHRMIDESAASVGEVAERISIDKLTLIQFARSDMKFARLVAAKISPRLDGK